MGILSRIFGDPNKKVLDRLWPIVFKINDLEEELTGLSDLELRRRAEKLKQRVRSLEEQAALAELDKILPEAFALVREASRRVLGQRHFDVQLLGGIVLHQGKIAEMKTGEGKTLAATLPAFLNGLLGKGVHIVTVNDYLAKRDTQWMGSIYDFLGLSVGCLQHEKAYRFKREGKIELYGEANLEPVERKEAYRCDIVYGTNNEFGFDYLRDNMVWDLSDFVQRELNFAVIDEIDSILIDEARTPLIISAPAEEPVALYYQFADFARRLKPDEDYTVDEKDRAVLINEKGIAKVEQWLGIKNIYEAAGIEYVHHLENALRAKELFIRDRDYIVKDGEIIIVDEFTGRLMYGRRYSEGIHQAIEAKEGVPIQQESQTLATITFQNYFRLYNKLAGMTGTAATEAEEFAKIYNLEVVEIPTHRPMIRIDAQDRIYKTEEAKFKAVVEEVKRRHSLGQPVLVGTVSIEKNERLSRMLQREGVRCEVLNAKNHEREAAIIAQAGKLGAVTVATNMAGRGVDIILGGSLPPNPTKEEIKAWEKEHQKVVELGGLCVIGTERHESRRIDNQLRGRSGRQGDPGYSLFFVSLEDDLMRLFGSERVKAMMDRLGLPDDQPIEHPLISKAIENAQKKVEGNNFDIRKHLLEYDDVLNKQREVIYSKRREFLEKENLKEDILKMVEEEINHLVEQFFGTGDLENNFNEFLKIIANIFPLSKEEASQIAKLPNERTIASYLFNLAKKEYEAKERKMGENFRLLEKAIVLRTLDSLWVRHLDTIEHLKTGIGLRGYGQKDPLVEFKSEAYMIFQRLLAEFQANVVNIIYKANVVSNQNQSQSHQLIGPKKGFQQASHQVVLGKKKIGRNEPCPCGSGKKYKKCCGR